MKLLIILLAICTISCLKREKPLTWETDWTIPVAHGSMGLGDLLPDSLLISNADSSLQLVFEHDIFTFDLEELVAIPDTTLIESYTLPVVTPVSFSPGQVFINQPKENLLAIADVELVSVIVASGQVAYKLESTVAGDVVYTYKIPSATDPMGVPFEKIVNVPAGSVTNKSIVIGSFDLAGYTIDMTGTNGNAINTIATSIDCKINPSYSGNVSVSNQDTIIISNTLQSIKIERADGYFGQHQINTGLNFQDVDGFEMFESGNLSISQFTMNFNIENGIGVDALIGINQFSTVGNAGNSTNLMHPIIGSTQLLNRAYESNGSFVPSNLSFLLDENNSNISSMIGEIPNSIGYDFDVEINPLGNISGYNDFVDKDSPLRLFINASMPLNVIANDLVLVDTISVNIADTSKLNSMKLMLDLANGFPLNAEISIAVLDQNDKIANFIFSPGLIDAAMIGSNGKVSQIANSYHEIEINGKDMERLKLYGKVILKVKFNSPVSSNPINIYDYYKLNYSIKANANVTISIGE